jgi:diacylglycerol kinase (ATP)
MHPEPPPENSKSRFKSEPGLIRVWRAFFYSAAGFRAAFRHEAAFRQELAVGLPLIGLACWLAPTRWHALAMAVSVIVVWIVELLNSAIEALADTVTLEQHPMIKRAKDMGSAAVMVAIATAVAVWAVLLWP